MIVQPHTCESLGARLGEVAAQHLVATFEVAFRDPGDRKIVHQEGFSRIETGADHLFGNFVYGIAPDDAASTRRAIAPFAALDRPSGALFPYAEVSEDVAAALDEGGLQFVGEMPAMAVDIATLSPSSLGAEDRFIEVGAERADEWVEALAIGYEIPAEVARLFSPKYAPASGDLRYFAVERAGRLEAVSLCTHLNGVAGIYCVATRPEARGRGLGAHVTAEPLRRAAAEGFNVGVLHASEMGYPVYERLGFWTVSGVRVYVRMPQAAGGDQR